MGRIMNLQTKKWRTMRLKMLRVAVLAAGATVALGSLAWGQPAGQYRDYDGYGRRDEAHEHGFKNGYQDGLRTGQYDAERGRRFKYKNDDWEDSLGYEHWMGNHGDYKHAYREGYERGYREAYSGSRRDWDRDRDDRRWHDHDRDN